MALYNGEPLQLYEVKYKDKYYLTLATDSEAAKGLVCKHLKLTVHMHFFNIQVLPAREHVIKDKLINLGGFWSTTMKVTDYARTVTEPQLLLEYYF